MTGDFKSFDSKLRGTWVSNDPGLYSGTLKIDSETITIDGYGEDWTSMVGDDSKRPFKDIPKSINCWNFPLAAGKKYCNAKQIFDCPKAACDECYEWIGNATA